MGTTTRWGLRWPGGTDIPAGHTQIQNLAEDVENKALPQSGTLALRPTAATAGLARRYFATDTNQSFISDGTNWHELPQVPLTDADVSAANKDGGAGTASLRTLGAGALQAAAGTDARFTDQRVPTDGSVTLAKLAAAVAQAMFSPGDIKAGAYTTPDAGWLFCDGSAVSRSGANLALFNKIGTLYGVGDGSTTFNLPDLRGRTLVGVDGAAARLDALDALGNSGGAQKHALNTAELAAHAHTDGTLATSTDGNHNHEDGFAISGGYQNGAAALTFGSGGTGFAGAHFHDVTGSTANTGSGTAHQNMQPYQIVNFFIKL